MRINKRYYVDIFSPAYEAWYNGVDLKMERFFLQSHIKYDQKLKQQKPNKHRYKPKRRTTFDIRSFNRRKALRCSINIK